MAPTREEWDVHKDVLRGLFFKCTLEETIKCMDEDFGFIARYPILVLNASYVMQNLTSQSKTQYERKFREWKFRKNVKTSDREWLYILETRRKRERVGKRSAFTLFGKPILEKTILKRESRYTLSELDRMQKLFADLNPPCPEGILVSTPGGVVVPTTRSPSYQPLASIQIELHNEIATVEPTRYNRNTPRPVMFTTYFGSQVRHNPPVNKVYTGPQSNSSMHLSTAGFLHQYLNEPSVELEILEDDSLWQDFPPATREVSTAPYIPDRLVLLYLPGFIMGPVPQSKNEIQTMARTQPGSSMLDKEVDDLSFRLERLFGPSDMECLEEFINFAIFSRSNGLKWAFGRDILVDWLLDQGKPLLKRIMAVRLPTVQAFLESVVYSMISENKLAAGREFLEADTEQNLFPGRPEERLSAAVIFGSVELVTEIVKEITQCGMDLNCAPYLRQHIDDFRIARPVTILGGATDHEIAQILLEAGADVDALHRSSDDRLPLPLIHWAVRKGNIELVKLFIQHNADINQQDPENDLLYWAVSTGKLELVELLIEAGAHSNLLESLDIYQCLDKSSGLAAPELYELFNIATLLGVSKRRKVRHPDQVFRDAAGKGYYSVVHRLLLAGLDSNAQKRISWDPFFEEDEMQNTCVVLPPPTPLIAAVEGNHIKIVELLLNNQANVNGVVLATYGSSALECAKKLGHWEVVSCLLRHGASPSPPRSEAERVLELQLAAVNGDVAKAKALVDSGVDPSHILDIFPEYERYNKDSRTVQRLLSVFQVAHGGRLNVKSPVKNFTPLEIFIRVRDYTNARKMVQQGAVVDDVRLKDSFDILSTHVYRDWEDTDKIEMIDLLKEMARFSKHPLPILEHLFNFAIVLSMDLMTIKRLATDCARASSGPWTGLDDALHQALASSAPYGADSDGYNLVSNLISLGANVHAVDEFGYSSIKQAICSGAHHDIIQLLLDVGAQVNEPPYTGAGRYQTVLQEAVWRPNSCDVIELLLDAGAEIDALAHEDAGLTALQEVAMRGYLRIALMLLQRGADPNAPGAKYGGSTALEFAADEGRLDMVQLLLNAGANVSPKAIDLAKRHKHFVISDLLDKRLHR
ncbi:ankyrin repeat-containing domain protein [Bisporella sp. PMI_857]|nr:ankyrin repeat-containing domain protein [Bisporella sp. PMI_857]